MRKALVGLGLLIVVVFIAVLALPAFVDVNRYRPQIESKLQDRLGRSVSLGKMGLSLSPLGFRVENVVVAEAPEFNSGRPFADVQTLYVRPELLPLLHGEVRIDSLQIRQPK